MWMVSEGTPCTPRRKQDHDSPKSSPVRGSPERRRTGAALAQEALQPGPRISYCTVALLHKQHRASRRSHLSPAVVRLQTQRTCCAEPTAFSACKSTRSPKHSSTLHLTNLCCCAAENLPEDSLMLYAKHARFHEDRNEVIGTACSGSLLSGWFREVVVLS